MLDLTEPDDTIATWWTAPTVTWKYGQITGEP